MLLGGAGRSPTPCMVSADSCSPVNHDTQGPGVSEGCTHSPRCLSLWGGATSTTLSVSSPWLGHSGHTLSAYTSTTHKDELHALWQRGEPGGFRERNSALCGRKPNSTNSSSQILMSWFLFSTTKPACSAVQALMEGQSCRGPPRPRCPA